MKKKQEERILKRARDLAATGRHISWFYVAHEIREKGEPLAEQLLEQEPIRSEIDRICEKATRTKWAAEVRERSGL